jgi:hypothetical protein
MNRLRTLVLGVALLSALAGCSSSGGDGVASAGGAQTSTSAQTTSKKDQAFKFVQCMRDHGVDMADPAPDGKGGYKLGLDKVDRDDPALRPALEACHDLLPVDEDVLKKLSDPATQDALRAFAACMREHGVDMPDPDPNGGFGSDFLKSLDKNSPTFQTAFAACQDKLQSIRGDK